MRLSKKIILPFLLLILNTSYLILYTDYVYAQPTETENISVSALTPPGNSAYQLSIAPIDGKSPVTQSTKLTYKVTYGSLGHDGAGIDTPITLTADWKSSDAQSNVPILNYVPGSAQNAFGDTPPVVDLISRMISWSIPSLPPGTVDQNVKFEVETNSNYTGPNDINFTIKANMNNQYMTMNEVSSSKTYRYDKNLITTAGPTSTPTPAASPALSPTPQPALSIKDVSLTTVSDNTATIQIDSNVPAIIRIDYGTSANILNKSLTTTGYSLRNRLTPEELSSDTTYYFRITITDRAGRTKRSEIFSFKTALSSTTPVLDENIIILTNQGKVLISDIQKKNMAYQTAFLPPDSEFEFTYSLRKTITLKSIDLVIRNKVLGTAIIDAQSQTFTIPMKAKSPDLYFGSFKTQFPGLFEVSVRLIDDKANIIEQKIAELKIMPYMSILEQNSQNPIPDSRVYLYYYNYAIRKYLPLSSDLFSNIPNPSYSDINGLVKITLPEGKYRAEASSLFYDKERVDFTIGPSSGQEFPKIYLKKNPLSLLSLLSNLQDLSFDSLNRTTNILNGFAHSLRLFNILNVLTISSFILISFLLFSFKFHIRLKDIPLFLHFHLTRHLTKEKINMVFGKAVNELSEPLSRVRIEIQDPDTKNIFAHAVTNKAGRFIFPESPKIPANASLIFMKDGFKPKAISLLNEEPGYTGIRAVLSKGDPGSRSPYSVFTAKVEEFAGMLFETFLIISIILEFLFFLAFGLVLAAPFFILSILNIILWLFFLRDK
jgi:hypothetical protein